MKKLIVVTDWADDTLTCQEVRTAVEGFSNEPQKVRISFVSSTPSTIHTSFLLRQIVEIEERYGRPLETVIFQNTDPRLHSKTSIQESRGADLVIIRLKSGIHLMGPNAGYDYSMLLDKVDVVFTYPGMNKGSQFRSRDLYSRVAAHLMEAMQDDMELEEAHISIIPGLQGDYVGHVDNYGNIKTTIHETVFKEKYSYGDEMDITINGVKKKVLYVDNFFGGNRGDLVIFPGSSGDKRDPYLEISVWRHFDEEDQSTGSAIFDNAKPGMKVMVE